MTLFDFNAVSSAAAIIPKSLNMFWVAYSELVSDVCKIGLSTVRAYKSTTNAIK